MYKTQTLIYNTFRSSCFVFLAVIFWCKLNFKKTLLAKTCPSEYFIQNIKKNLKLFAIHSQIITKKLINN